MAMPRALSAVLATALLLAADRPAPAADVPPAIAEAQRQLAAGQARRAVELFESALPGANDATRPMLLEGLGQAYRLAIVEAEGEGDAQAARTYRENLAILERKPVGDAPPSRPETAPEPPREAPAPSDEAAAGSAAESPPKGIGAPPEPPEPLASEGPAEEAPAPEEEEPDAPDPDPDTEPDAAPGPQENAPPGPSNAAASDIAAADAAFLARRYDQAGRIYTKLAEAGQLPEVRRDPWAYCRMVEVVRRINAGPRSAQEWAWIRNETVEIRRLSPRNWYAEYLRNLADELSTRAPRPRPDTMVLRGAAPTSEGPPDATPPGTAPRPTADLAAERAASRSSPQPAAPLADGSTGRRGEPTGEWQVWETTNFRILHQDESLARQAATVAERARAEQQARWSAAAIAPPWSPKCEVYLYPSAEVFSRMTGQPAQSPGFSTMALNGGRVTVRRINLRADHENLIEAVLPHEITHVVLADLFPSIQIPRWADEGMAVLAEPHNEQDLRAGDLAEPLESGRLFRLADLMTMDYPEAQHWALYYAQSVSLTRFLVELGTEPQFVRFVQSAQAEGIEPALRRFYGIAGYDDLERRWQEHARSRMTAVASNDPDPDPRASDEDTTRR